MSSPAIDLDQEALLLRQERLSLQIRERLVEF